jgi:transposase
MRYELTDYEWAAIKPMLPNKPRGVPRVNDRRVLNGILRSRCSYCPDRMVPVPSLRFSLPFRRVDGWADHFDTGTQYAAADRRRR